MRNQFKLLNNMLDQAQELINKGDTASASNIIQMVLAECSVVLADKLTEIEKHLATLANGRKADQPTNLEKVVRVLKGG